MQKYFHFIFLIVMVSAPGNFLFGQGNNITSLNGNYEPRLAGEVIFSSETTDGYQYYLNEWVEGAIELITGETVYCENLNYNGYLDELIWVHSELYQHVIVDKNLVKSFTLTTRNQKAAVFDNLSRPVRFRTTGLNFFAQRLYANEMSLYVYRQIPRIGTDYYYQNNNLIGRPRIRYMPLYFILQQDQNPVPLKKLNRRSIYQIFPEYKKELRQELRRNRIRILDEEDFVRAMAVIERVVSEERGKVPD